MVLIKQIIIGVLIGSGLVLPGVSGAVLAITFGVYENIIKAINHFKEDWKKNIFFLLPITIGMLLGIFIFGNITNYFFYKYPIPTKFSIIGLILGGIPLLFSKLKNNDTNKINYNYLIISFIISYLLGITISNSLIDISNIKYDVLGFVFLFFTGFIYAVGKVIPGISSSLFLILIGMYSFFLKVVSSPLSLTINEYIKLIPIILGFILGVLFLMKLVEYLFKKYYNNTYSSIIGFIIGTIPIIYPKIYLNIQGLISIILLVICFYLSYKISFKNN